MKKWDPHALVAVILAGGVTGVLVLLIVVEFFPHHGHVSDAEAAALTTVLGAVVGALSTYLGMDYRDRHKPPRCPFCGRSLDDDDDDKE